MTFLTPDQELVLLQEIKEELSVDGCSPTEEDLKRKLTYDAVSWYIHYASGELYMGRYCGQ